MLNKGTAAYSIFKFKCPQCHVGDIFVNNNPYNIVKMGKMHEHCPNCQLKYEIEPGFFLGAMYVGYALGVATIFPSGLLISYFFPEWSVFKIVLICLIELTLLMPLYWRLSRSMYLNIFVRYQPK